MSGLRWEALKAVAVVMAVLLLTACSGPATEPGLQETPIVVEPTPVPPPPTAPTPLPEPTATTSTQDGAQVEVVVSKSVYQVGEDISFTIVNHSDEPIYYRYSGCDHPFIVQWVDDEEVLLAINILEYVPNLREIEPGGSLPCAWDQKHHAFAGSDPDVQGHRYQVRFLYAFTEEDVDTQDGTLEARSQLFTIK